MEFEYTNANEMEELGSSNAFAEFMTIFQRFDEQVAIKMDQAKIDTSMEALLPTATQPKEAEKADAADQAAGSDPASKPTGGKAEKKKAEVKMTKKQRKQLAQMKIFDLKMQVKRPDLVEAWDVTSKDPLFLLDCKQVRNSVPVPRHWAQKRRYLQYKRGIHKIPFKLPDFIE